MRIEISLLPRQRELLPDYVFDGLIKEGSFHRRDFQEIKENIVWLLEDASIYIDDGGEYVFECIENLHKDDEFVSAMAYKVVCYYDAKYSTPLPPQNNLRLVNTFSENTYKVDIGLISWVGIPYAPSHEFFLPVQQVLARPDDARRYRMGRAYLARDTWTDPSDGWHYRQLVAIGNDVYNSEDDSVEAYNEWHGTQVRTRDVYVVEIYTNTGGDGHTWMELMGYALMDELNLERYVNSWGSNEPHRLVSCSFCKEEEEE